MKDRGSGQIYPNNNIIYNKNPSPVGQTSINEEIENECLQTPIDKSSIYLLFDPLY